MNTVYLSKNILYLISQMQVAKDLYLEGGAALSFVYKIKRKYSGDLDFTVPDRRMIRIFKEEYQSFVKKPEFYIEFPITFDKNCLRLNLIDKKVRSFHLDFTVVENKLFNWCWAKISSREGDIIIKTHTLEDIIAEKICCVLSFDRFEYKDIVDINKVALLVSVTRLKNLVLRKIMFKFIGKRKDFFADLLMINKQKFFKNAVLNGYSLKNFNNNYLEVIRLIRKVLLE